MSINSKLHLAEGAISNVFLVKNGTVFTPPLTDGALPGVIRHIILNNLKLNSLALKEDHISIEALFNADEIFVSNALMGVKPIHKLDSISFHKPYEITNLISFYLRKQFNYI